MLAGPGGLQKSPGRLVQTLEQSSYDVWSNSFSGVNPNSNSVSYYVKGQVVAFLLDARLRRATAGRKSLDDVTRLAYKRYSGERGFTPEEFRKTAREVAGIDLTDWFRKSASSTEELDYAEALDWFGLRFAAGTWKLEMREDATEAQKNRLRAWLQGDRIQNSEFRRQNEQGSRRKSLLRLAPSAFILTPDSCLLNSSSCLL